MTGLGGQLGDAVATGGDVFSPAAKEYISKMIGRIYRKACPAGRPRKQLDLGEVVAAELAVPMFSPRAQATIKRDIEEQLRSGCPNARKVKATSMNKTNKRQPQKRKWKKKAFFSRRAARRRAE